MNSITVITESALLTQYCDSWQNAEYVTVDTEFMREHTYWPKLCLIQVGGPNESVIIDPLVKELDLTPFFKIGITWSKKGIFC